MQVGSGHVTMLLLISFVPVPGDIVGGDGGVGPPPSGLGGDGDGGFGEVGEGGCGGRGVGGVLWEGG